MMYRRFLVILLATVVCGQAVAFISVNVGAAHYLRGGRPPLVTTLHHLRGAPSDPKLAFLRAASKTMAPGAAQLVPVGSGGIGGLFAAQARYTLFPNKVHLDARGTLRAQIRHAHALDSRYMVLVRPTVNGVSVPVPWPHIDGARVVVRADCCLMVELPAP